MKIIGKLEETNKIMVLFCLDEHGRAYSMIVRVLTGRKAFDTIPTMTWEEFDIIDQEGLITVLKPT